MKAARLSRFSAAGAACITAALAGVLLPGPAVAAGPVGAVIPAAAPVPGNYLVKLSGDLSTAAAGRSAATLARRFGGHVAAELAKLSPAGSCCDRLSLMGPIDVRGTPSEPGGRR
ncbi:hypothetical protein [Pilimelia anulata]|nr:hypothetical protein [Pilimelia anulata]